MANEIVHINKKEFLEPNAIHSSSMIHSKMYKTTLNERPKCQLRISDCNQAIRWWNYCDTDEDRAEFITKIDNMLKHVQQYRKELGDKFEQEFNDSRFKQQ